MLIFKGNYNFSIKSCRQPPIGHSYKNYKVVVDFWSKFENYKFYNQLKFVIVYLSGVVGFNNSYQRSNSVFSVNTYCCINTKKKFFVLLDQTGHKICRQNLFLFFFLDKRYFTCLVATLNKICLARTSFKPLCGNF